MQDLNTVAFQQDTSKQGYSPDPPSLAQSEMSGIQTKVWILWPVSVSIARIV